MEVFVAEFFEFEEGLFGDGDAVDIDAEVGHGREGAGWACGVAEAGAGFWGFLRGNRDLVSLGGGVVVGRRCWWHVCL